MWALPLLISSSMTMGIEKTKKSQNIEKGKEKRHVRYVKNEQTHEGR